MKRKRTTTRAWLALLAFIAVVAVSLPSFAATAPASAPPASQEVRSGRAFASLSLPKHTLYVGESVPVTIRGYFAPGTGVTITDTPKPDTADFTMAVGDASQGRATIGGDTYLVASWKGHLSPAKAGHYGLRIKIPSTLEWQTAIHHAASPTGTDDALGDPFGDLSDLFGRSDQGDPFAAMQQRMQQMMNRAMQDFDVGPVQKQDVVLESPSAELTVLPLPAEGRPPTFTGAVGHFELEAEADTTHVRAGEPIELRLVIRGQGNLDRVSTAGLPDSKGLKAYAPTFTQKDDTKTFVQALVPQQAGLTELPPVELSYFDPDAARYVTLRSAAIPIEVAPGRALAPSSAGAVPDAESGPTLAPNADIERDPVRSLRPVYTHKEFWLAQLAPLGMLATAAALVVRRRRLSSDPHRAMRRAAKRALHQYSAAMNRACSAGNVEAFFAAARGAFQQRLGALWGIVPEAITLIEIERRMKGAQLETLRVIFEADSARFGVGAGQQDLTHWNEAVRQVLAHPEAS